LQAQINATAFGTGPRGKLVNVISSGPTVLRKGMRGVRSVKATLPSVRRNRFIRKSPAAVHSASFLRRDEMEIKKDHLT
jgi:hypothetical protein